VRHGIWYADLFRDFALIMGDKRPIFSYEVVFALLCVTFYFMLLDCF
jgi:hypothetical protein